MDRDLGERWIIPQDQGAGLIETDAPAHRLALASASIAGVELLDEGEWLRAVTEAVFRCAGDELIVEALVVEPPSRRGVSRGVWRAGRAAAAGEADERTLGKLIQDGRAGWPGEPTDDGQRLNAAWIAERAELWSDALWRASRASARRAERGVYDFLRAVAPFEEARGRRAIVLQLSGSHPTWRSNDAARQSLAALTAISARAFVARFVRRSLMRGRLLELLSEAQRELTPMLLAGLSEATIAQRIGKSRHTVHDHVKSVYRAWGVSSRLEMKAVWAGTLESPVMSGATPPPQKRRRSRARRSEEQAPPPQPEPASQTPAREN